jgi:D-alanine-D-alanine ligase
VSDRLRRLALLYESESACRERLVAQGQAEEVAAEIAFYLRQATDFEAACGPIAAALGGAGVELAPASLDEPARWLPWLTTPVPGTMVWCLTDGFAWYRGSFVSSTAALLDLPQFGSPPAAQHLCQDKFRCVALAQAAGLAVPPTVLVEDREPLSPLGVLPSGAALFVKPNTLGAKLGIGECSRVGSLDEALGLSAAIWQRYRDRALIQAFVPGRDVRVSFMELADGPPTLGIYAVHSNPRGFPTLADSLRITARRTADAQGLRLENLAGTPAAVRIEKLVRRMSRIAGLRDYGSFDIRLAEDGTPWFLEFEVCPAITIYDFLTYLREAHGLDLPGAIAAATARAYVRRQP